MFLCISGCVLGDQAAPGDLLGRPDREGATGRHRGRHGTLHEDARHEGSYQNPQTDESLLSETGTLQDAFRLGCKVGTKRDFFTLPDSHSDTFV